MDDEPLDFPADRAERVGRERELPFPRLLEKLPAGAYTCDCAGLITYFNRHAVQIWGRSPKLNDSADRFCGSFRLFAPDGTPISHDECWMARALREGKDYNGEEIVIEREDGSRVTVLAHASPLYDDSGKMLGAMNVLVDISDRKQAEAATTLLAAIVESSDDAIVSKSLDGRILSWNAGAERLFGYAAEEAIGSPITIIIPPDRLDEEGAILARLRRGERIEHFETQRVSKQGRRIDISLTISPIRDSAGRIVGASKVARDVTGQKQAAKALRASEDRFRVFSDNSPAAIFIKDLAGRYTLANPLACQALGRPEGVVGLSDADLLPLEVAARLREHDAEVISTGRAIEHEEFVGSAAGNRDFLAVRFPLLDAGGETTGVCGVAIDISDRKRSAEALSALRDQLATQLSDLRRLHEMSERLSTTLALQSILEETLRTAAALEDADLGLLSLCEPSENRLRVEASLGYSDEVLESIARIPAVGSTCFRDRKRVVVADVETDPTFAPHRDAACRAGIRAIHSTPLITRSGKIVGVLSLHFRDTHSPSDQETQLIDLCARQAVDFIENARLYDQLRDADQRKDEFLAMLAHELRNPLAPISNSLHILRMSGDLSPADQRVREIMERQVGHMVRLVDDLLEVSRITRGKVEMRKESVSLAAILENAVETSRPLIEAAGHQLAIGISPEPMTLEADPVRLTQVIANLLNNAAKYTEASGQIWLTAQRDGNHAVVSVRDTGMGISADMQPHIFDLFTQVDRTLNRAQGGLGIGLTLAKSMVQMHGGQIDVKSPGAGQGSEFIVRLPLAPSTSQVADSAAALQSGRIPLRSRCILVVDDARDSAYMLGKLLETIGQQVHTTSDPASAIDLARSRRPEVIITDIGMPHMDGYELARRLRQDQGLADVVLVALTGYGQDSDRQQALDAGFDHHLVKPVSLAALHELLGAIDAGMPVPAPSIGGRNARGE